MSGYCLVITCPTCGSDVEHVNGSATGWLSVAIVACEPCNRQWEVAARLSPHAAARVIRTRADRERSAARR